MLIFINMFRWWRAKHCLGAKMAFCRGKHRSGNKKCCENKMGHGKGFEGGFWGGGGFFFGFNFYLK